MNLINITFSFNNAYAIVADAATRNVRGIPARYNGPDVSDSLPPGLVGLLAALFRV